jgi:rhomboid protease GluP
MKDATPIAEKWPTPRWRLRATWLSQTPSSWAGAAAALATLALVIGSLIFQFDIGGAQNWMPASQTTVWQEHEWSRAFFALFAHADLRHILGNAALFFIFAALLNGYFGFWVFPILSFALGTITNALTVASYPADVQLIGASGMVYAMGAIWIILYFMISRNLSLPQRILRAVGVSLMLFFPTSLEMDVSYRAHAIGFAVGLISGLIYFFIRRNEFRGREWIDYDATDEQEDEFPQDPSGAVMDT